MNKRKLPVHVEVWEYEKYGLNSPSTILVEQAMTVEICKLNRRIGKIEDVELLEKICIAMGIQFPIMTFTRQITIKG